MDEDLMPRKPSSGLATTKTEKLSKSKQNKRDQAAVTTVNLTDLATSGKLSPEATFDLIVSGLDKEADNRSLEEQQAIAIQDEFTLEIIVRSMAENQRLDDAHNQKLDAMAAEQRKVLAKVQDIFKRSWESHNNMVERMNTLSPEAQRIFEESFGALVSSDPND